MKQRKIKADDIRFDDQNLNQHTKKGRELVRKSLGELGGGRSVLADKNGKLIAGNLTAEEAIEQGFSFVEIEVDNPKTIVVVKRPDLDLDSVEDNRARKMALVDNTSAAMSFNLDIPKAKDQALAFGFSASDWGISDKELEKGYSKKVKSPIYEPRNEKPTIEQIIDTGYYDFLMKGIEQADIDEKEKGFLRMAAARHIVFNFELIADYYAHSSAVVQKLMEDSAMVVIDFNRAIELGFIQMMDEMVAQYGSEYHENEEEDDEA